MKQKHTFFTLNRFTNSVLALLVIAAAATVVVLQRNRTGAAPSVKPGVGAAVPSQFSFTGTLGWWQGATSKSDIALFHNYDCFVSAQHKTGTIASDQAKRQKNQDSLTNDGYIVTPGVTQTLTIQTNTGPRQYQLQQSSVTAPAGADKLEGGQEFGYLQLSNGYLFVEGYCDTPDELPATIPALQAIKFDETK